MNFNRKYKNNKRNKLLTIESYLLFICLLSYSFINAQGIIIGRVEEFNPPCLDFGERKYIIENCERRNLISGDNNLLVYESDNPNRWGNVIYFFEDKKLDNIIVLLKEMENNENDEINKYLEDNFREIGKGKNGEIMYLSYDNKIFSTINIREDLGRILVIFPTNNDILKIIKSNKK